MRIITIAAICVAVAGSAAAARSTASGLHGVVMRGPITPVCVAEQPCVAPAKGFTMLFSRGGQVVARTTAGTKGRYRIRLAPGRYAVRIGRRGSFKEPDPSFVRVPVGLMRRADFYVDTGIR